jgi:hypothetical protein
MSEKNFCSSFLIGKNKGLLYTEAHMVNWALFMSSYLQASA